VSVAVSLPVPPTTLRRAKGGFPLATRSDLRRSHPARARLGARLRWIVAASIGATALVPLPASVPASGQTAGPPDVVILVTDDQRIDQLARMPSTQQLLVRRGVRFTRAFASNPLCCPSRASILRGQLSHTTGIYLNEGANGGWAGFRDRGLESSTLATWLDGAGYRTGLIGRYLNGYSATTNHVPPGWDHWRGGAVTAYHTGPPVHHSVLTTRFADEFIRETPAGTPLFLHVGYLAPHAPATPAARYATDPRCDGITTSRIPSFNEADVADKPAPVRTKPSMTPEEQAYIGTTLPTNQCRALLSVDDSVAAIVNALRETGRLGNTLLVFMSDNGLFLGEHRLQAWKILTYEEAIRIPLVIRYDPLTRDAASRSDARLVMNVDIAPTIADLVGLDVRPGCPTPPYGACDGGFDGRSLLPLLSGSGSGWRNDLLVENHQACGVRTRQHLFVRYRSGEEELYDLAADPYQLDNLLFGPPSPEVTALRDRLLARLAVLCQPPAPGVGF
jgi:N-acetylglucosamine-6-sulfatase